MKQERINNNDGFTLLELVMTIILIGIMSVGLYQVVMFGINDYAGNEQYLHSDNSMTYAMQVIRRNLENAAKPAATSSITPSSSAYCPLGSSINPAATINSTTPIVIANLTGQTAICGGNSHPACNEVAFYQNVGTSSAQQLVVFCVNNNILYQEVTISNGTTTSYPITDNINYIRF